MFTSLQGLKGLVPDCPSDLPSPLLPGSIHSSLPWSLLASTPFTGPQVAFSHALMVHSLLGSSAQMPFLPRSLPWLLCKIYTTPLSILCSYPALFNFYQLQVSAVIFLFMFLSLPLEEKLCKGNFFICLVLSRVPCASNKAGAWKVLS